MTLSNTVIETYYTAENLTKVSKRLRKLVDPSVLPMSKAYGICHEMDLYRVYLEQLVKLQIVDLDSPPFESHYSDDLEYPILYGVTEFSAYTAKEAFERIQNLWNATEKQVPGDHEYVNRRRAWCGYIADAIDRYLAQ